MSDAPIPIAAPDTGDEEWQALREVLASGWLTQGPRVRAFEEAFAARAGTRHALATTSCTAALHLALLALEVGPGDEVIVPAFAWVAVANVVLHCGATPVLADIEPETWNLDPAQVAARRTPRTRALIAVHLFGRCVDTDALAAAAPGVAIVEDAACAAGATLRGRPAGALGRVGCFSFHPRKVITTGEGGMVTTDDDALAARVDALRNHGASVPEEARHRGPRPFELPAFEVAGWNYRMTDLQGAVGLVQLGKLDALVAARDARAAWYRERLASLEWLRLPGPADGRHGWQAFVAEVREGAPLERDALLERLHAEGISARPGTHAIPTLGYHRARLGVAPEDYPHALAAAQRTLALPLHSRMRDADYERVVAALRRV